MLLETMSNVELYHAATKDYPKVLENAFKIIKPFRKRILKMKYDNLSVFTRTHTTKVNGTRYIIVVIVRDTPKMIFFAPVGRRMVYVGEDGIHIFSDHFLQGFNRTDRKSRYDFKYTLSIRLAKFLISDKVISRAIKLDGDYLIDEGINHDDFYISAKHVYENLTVFVTFIGSDLSFNKQKIREGALAYLKRQNEAKKYCEENPLNTEEL